MKRPGLAERLGWAPRRKGRAVIIWVQGEEDLAPVRGLVAELAREHPRVNFLVVSESGAFALPDGVRQVLRAPIAFRFVLALFFSRTRPQAILIAASVRHRAIEKTARRHDIRVHLIDDEYGDDAAQFKADVKASILNTKRKHAGMRRSMLSVPGIRRLSERSLVPVADLDSLASALRFPQRILCLGNGPSSESEEVKALVDSDFDAVFRVNHRWLERGLFTRPHMVFAAGSKPVRRIAPPCIFCVQDAQRAEKVRQACLHLRSGRSLVVAEELGILDDWTQLDSDGFGSFAPTNGTVMLILARALKPRHIAVAGVDLFSDAQGAYPGDPSTANAYGIFHSRNKELAFTRRWVQAVGVDDSIDLRLVGDALQALW